MRDMTPLCNKETWHYNRAIIVMGSSFSTGERVMYIFYILLQQKIDGIRYIFILFYLFLWSWDRGRMNECVWKYFCFRFYFIVFSHCLRSVTCVWARTRTECILIHGFLLVLGGDFCFFSVCCTLILSLFLFFFLWWHGLLSINPLTGENMWIRTHCKRHGSSCAHATAVS